MSTSHEFIRELSSSRLLVMLRRLVKGTDELSHLLRRPLPLRVFYNEGKVLQIKRDCVRSKKRKYCYSAGFNSRYAILRQTSKIFSSQTVSYTSTEKPMNGPVRNHLISSVKDASEDKSLRGVPYRLTINSGETRAFSLLP